MIERYRKIQRQRAAGELDASGFTLIELLIVIVVLGILAAVVVFALGGVTGQSVQAACNADAKTVQTAVAAYEAQTGNEPAAVTLQTTAQTPPNPVAGAGDLVPTYLQSWPENTGSDYAITLTGAGVVQITLGGTWDSTTALYAGGGTATDFTAGVCSTATT